MVAIGRRPAPAGRTPSPPPQPLSIVLVSPPLCEPGVPNLAIEELAELARARGHRVETLHAALLQTTFFRDDLVHGLGAQGCFTPLYCDLDPNAFSEQLVDAVFADFAHRDRVTPHDRERIAERFYFGTIEADRTVERIMEQIPRGSDVVGLSVGFDSQKLPAAVLARRLRERGETATIVVGGTGTDEAMGPALLERFAELDLVLQGEADESWPVLLDRLAAAGRVDGAGDFGDVPGAVFRRAGRIVSVPERTPSRAFFGVKVPDYSAFVEQRARSEHTRGQLCLLVETSRGCWWGKKHHCTFCGIRSVDEEYRSRDPADAVAVLTELYDRYEPSLLYCTDPIVPATYHATAWPALHRARADGRDWRIFYETKSSLKRRELARMAAAGILRVQPGIESFSTRCLEAMDKGAKGLQQIAYVKWAHAYGVTVNYGIISGMPPERPADLRAMTALAAKLWHLPPPADVNRLALHRFSPHYRDPEGFGLADVRPFRTQHVVYQCDRPLLDRLCYQLDFRVPEQDTEEYEQARDELVAAVIAWRMAFLAGAGLWVRAQGDVRVVGRSRSAEDLDVEVVDDPVEVLVLDACAERRSIPRLARAGGHDPEALWAAVRSLEARDLMVTEGDEALSLPIIPDLDPAEDAQWSEDQLARHTSVPVPVPVLAPRLVDDDTRR